MTLKEKLKNLKRLTERMDRLDTQLIENMDYSVQRVNAISALLASTTAQWCAMLAVIPDEQPKSQKEKVTL